MVVPIRDLGNITQSSTTMSSNSLNLTPRQDIDMVIDPIDTMFNLDNNFDEVKGCSLDLSIHRPRFPLLLSSECDEEYHIRIKWKSNRMDEDKSVNFSSNFSFEYAIQEG